MAQAQDRKWEVQVRGKKLRNVYVLGRSEDEAIELVLKVEGLVLDHDPKRVVLTEVMDYPATFNAR